MKSELIGADTSDPEILNISPHGFWIMVKGEEYFLDFEHFPWFRQATLQQLFTVQLLHGKHLFWPELDVDLDIETIQHPEKYPLVSRVMTLGEQDG